MKFDSTTLALAVATLAGVAEAQAEPFFRNPKPYSQDVLDNYNQLKYTAWCGPWSQRRGVGLNRDVPAGCKVDQVTMLHRHGARYPDKYTAVDQAVPLGKINQKKGQLKGSLEFANYWVPYTNPNDGWIAQESQFGPYAGLADGYNRGVLYRARYGHLYDGESVLPVFSSGYERIADTARNFAKGFFGYNVTELAAIQIIPETANQGQNTLVTECDLQGKPLTFCQVPDGTNTTVDNGPPWQYEEFARAAKRLNAENNLNLTAAEIPDLISVAAFELNIRGNSPWISVFTDEEWIAFEYLQSAYYYCYYGPGGVATSARGSVYLNATRELLNQGPEAALPLYFSFAHDTDITPVVSLLGFATQDNYDPTQVTFGNKWDVTDITPQSGHLVFERLICEDEADVPDSAWPGQYPLAFNTTDAGLFNGTSLNATYASNGTYPAPNQTWVNGTKASNKSSTAPKHQTGKENIYIRVVLNEAVAPLPNCTDGPGKSCSLSKFNEFVDQQLKGVDFKSQCNPPEGAPESLSFFWNWNATNQLNNFPDPVPYQAGLLGADGKPLPKGSS